MDGKRKIISERDYIGKFLLSLLHKRVFGGNGRIEKCAMLGQFRDYVKDNPLPNMEVEKLGTLLQKHAFLFNVKSVTKTDVFIIDMVQLRKYSHFLLKLLDERQKVEEEYRVTIEYPFGRMKGVEKLEVDENFEEEQLTFEANYIENEDKKFRLRFWGCCICQKNFKSEIDFKNHVEFHTQKTNFASLCLKNRNHIPFCRVSYHICKDSSLLRFCIKSLRSCLEIYDVIIVQKSAMLYPQESEIPFFLPSGNQSYFYIDCEMIEINREQPLVIVFKDCSSKNESKRYVEQHHILRMEPFNEKITSRPHINISSESELKCEELLDEYLPPSSLREGDLSTIYEICPEFLEYERNGKVIDEANIGDIYKILLQLEDITVLNLYDKLTQGSAIVSSCTDNFPVRLTQKANDIRIKEYFSVLLELDDNINVEDILKEGDKVEISGPQRVVYGTVEKVSKEKIVFYLLIIDSAPAPLVPDRSYQVKFRPFRYNLILQYRALELLDCFHDVKKMLFPEKISYTDEKIKISISPYNGNLAKNPEQLEAVERIVHHLDCEAPYVIFGPPGTGKTTTVVEAIYQLWKDNPKNRILVVGGSNSCVDEIAMRVLKVFKETDSLDENLLRIYSASQGRKWAHLDENLIEISNLKRGKHFYPNPDAVHKIPIVFATLSVAAIYMYGGLDAYRFSHVFVDECGASTEPEVIATLIGTITRGTKLILSGDPKQLGPVLQSKTAEELGLGISLLERLMNLECYQTEPGSKAYNRSKQIRLTKNFRTHPSILHMSNHLYYENDLEACAAESVTSLALNWYNLPSPNFPVIFHSVYGKTERRNGSPSLYNWAEMLTVMNYVKEIMYFGINGRHIEPHEIGIVSPYKSQVNLIRRELNARKWFEIEVGSVEKFQGQEKAVILLSTVRSRMRNLGFLVSPKRLNVSLTRAQALLVIVGNPETLSASPDFSYIIKYCKDNGALKIGKPALFKDGSVTCCTSTENLMNELNNLSIQGPEI